MDSRNEISLNVVGGQTVIVNTNYNVNDKNYLARNIFTKIPFEYNELVKNIN